jgi:hypothetical protein
LANDLALINQPLNRVGDFKFATRRRRNGAHSIVDCAIKQVHANKR